MYLNLEKYLKSPSILVLYNAKKNEWINVTKENRFLVGVIR